MTGWRLNKALTGMMLAYVSGRSIRAIAHERPGAAQVVRGRLHIGVLLAALSAPSAVFADTREEGPPTNTGSYYFTIDHSNLRRDIADVRYYYAQPSVAGTESIEPGSDFVFFGSGITGGFAGLWVPSGAGLRSGSGPAVPSGWSRDVQFGIDWRPDVSGNSVSGARQIGRALVGSEIDRIGVRADVTALLFDESGLGTTAWRVSGMLGSTSLSLVSGDAQVGGTTESDGGLLWDVGVGWSSGAMSLSAGYQSVLHIVDGNAADMAVLSLGADYLVLPGLSVFGEFNVIDDSSGLGDERLGTVVIVGTGLNF